MKHTQKLRLGIASIALACMAFSAQIAQADALVGSNVDSRVQIGFKANAEGVQEMLPEGWAMLPFPSGALKGANVLLVLEDRELGRDAEGKPTSPSNSRGLALLSMGKQVDGDGVKLFVLKVFTTNPNYDTFPDAAQAKISRETSTSGPANEGRQRMENWAIAPEDGGEVTVSLSFTTGKRSWVASKARPFSAKDPEHSRVFDYQQLIDLVMSGPVGKPLTGEFNFASSVPELAGLFDGSEEVIAIIDVPVYVREVFLPEN